MPGKLLSSTSAVVTTERERAVELIVADGHCPQIAELLPGALHGLVTLGTSSNPLQAISEALSARREQGTPVDTLHLVAHGRPGAFQIGGQWITSTNLIANAEQLARWKVDTIALWSCQVGQKPEMTALLRELSGALVFSAQNHVGQGEWKLRGPDSKASTPEAPFLIETQRTWPHRLDGLTQNDLSMFEPNGSCNEQPIELSNSLREAERLIAELLRGDNALSTLFQVFNGGAIEPTDEWLTKAKAFVSALQSGSLRLTVELRASSDLLGAYGAYAASGPGGEPVLYLNEAWVAQFSLKELTRLILEETGHWIDNQLNGSADTTGDEGEAFAATVLGTELSATEWNKINSENDTILLTIDGVEIELQLASLLFADTAFFAEDAATTSGKAPLEGNTLRLLGKVDATVDGDNDTRAGAVKYLFNSDPESDPLYSGNNVRGTLYAIDSSNRVVGRYYGEISRLYKTGSTVQAAQFYVYPNPSVVTDTGNPARTIFIDFGLVNGPSFTTGEIVKTSSDPVATALNALLPGPAPITTNPDINSVDLLPDCPTPPAPVSDISGNVLGNDNGGTITYAIDTAPNPDVLIIGNSGFGITAIQSNFTNVSVPVTAGSTASISYSELAGAYGILRIGADGSYNYDVDENLEALIALGVGQSVTETFTYTAADSKGATGSTTLTITINGANNEPVADNDYQLLLEGNSSTLPRTLFSQDASGGLLANDVDPDGETLTIIQAADASGNSDESLTSPVSITSSGAQTISRTVTYTYSTVGSNTANINNTGIGSTVWISKNGGTSWTNSGLVVAAVGTQNDKTVTFNGSLDISIGDKISFGGAGTTNSDSIDFVLDRSATTFVLTGTGSTPSSQLPVTGEGVPNGTVVSNVSQLSFQLNTGTATYTYVTLSNPATVGAGDPTSLDPGDSLSFLSGAILGKYGYLSLKSDGSYDYILTADIPNGVIRDEYFSYQVVDASGCTDTAVLHLEIFGDEILPPTLGADTNSVVEDGPDALGTLFTTADTGSLPFTVEAIWTADAADNPTPVGGSQVQIIGIYGRLTINGLGNYSYELNNSNPEVDALRTSGDTLSEVFYYEISDNQNPTQSSISTLTITINGANDAPVAHPDQAVAIEAGGVGNTEGGFNPQGALFLNDTDVDNGDQLSLSRIVAGLDASGLIIPTSPVNGEYAVAGYYGTLYIKDDGTYRYEVDNSNAIVDALSPTSLPLTEEFTYEVKDLAGAVDVETLTITISGNNDELIINGATYNEASPHIFWTITGAAGQAVNYVRLEGDPPGNADPFTDLSGNLEYLDASGNWQTFDASSNAVLDSSGSLIIRCGVNNDDSYESLETFRLIVAAGDGSQSSGSSSLLDDGTGLFPLVGPTGIPNLDSSGNLQVDPSGVLDDDRTLTISGATFNEASSFIEWSISGAAGQTVLFSSFSAADASGNAIPDGSGASIAQDLSGNLQFLDPSGNWQTFNGSNNAILDASGNTRIRIAVVNDNPAVYEGLENFKLLVTNTGGTDASGSGISSLIDDGTGNIIDPSGNPDLSGNVTPDDDRTLTISGATFNEASSFIEWSISGAAGQTVLFSSFSAADASGNAIPDGSGASIAQDLSGNLQFLDPSGNWQTFNGSNNAILDASGNTRIRIAVVNDNPAVYEGLENFKLLVTNIGGTDASGSGISSLIDDGTGNIIDPSGNPDLSGNVTPDDDRTLTISGATFNEASSFIEWSISGAAGQTVLFSSFSAADASGNAIPDGSGASIAQDLSGNLQFLDPSGNWQTFNGSNNAILDASGNTRIRIAVVNDNPAVYEGLENFKLLVTNTGGTDASGSGISSLIDDGTGNIIDPSGNPDLSGNVTPDDDRTLTISGATFNEASSFIEWSISGAAGQTVLFSSFSAADASGNAIPDGSGASIAQDLSGNLQFLDPSGNWQTFNGSNNAILDASGNTRIRIAVVNDNPAVYEGLENFKLLVTNIGGTDASGSGISSLIDDGTGNIIDPSGNPDLSGNVTPDDDRTLTISGATFNEASSFIEWSISGAAGQTVLFSSFSAADASGNAIPDGSGASIAQDLSGNLQFLDPSGNWQTFNGSNNAILDASGNTRIRIAVVNDNPAVYEGLENFKLLVTNTGGTDASGSGISSLIDDGTGNIIDPSGNPDLSGNVTPDDDRTLTISGATFNEASSFIEWSISGAAGQTVLFSSFSAADASGNAIPDGSGASIAQDLSGNLQFLDPSGNWQTFNGSNNAILDASGNTRIRIAVVNDNPAVYEGLENFKLLVTNTGGTDASGSGISSLIDDGTGNIIDPSGNPDLSGNVTPDDDRTLTISGATFNEASSFIEWSISGAAGQTVLFSSFSAADASGNAIPDGSGASIAQDLSGNLQFLDPSGNWQTFNGSNNAILDASGNTRIRIAVVNDNPAVYEGLENFKLLVTNTGGTDASGSGISSLIDDGTGNIIDPSGNPDLSGNVTPDDDRTLTISGATFNEASSFIEWSISGAAGQTVLFSSFSAADASGNAIPDGSGASIAQDLSGNLQFLDPSGNWQTFNGSNNAILDASGNTRIRIAVVNDNPAVYEGLENFKLLVTNTGGTDASGSGISSLIDDGTGNIIDPSGNPDLSGNVTPDDDRALTVSSPTVNEASPFAIFTVDGNPGQLVSLSLTPGTASPGSDYTPTIEVSVDGGLTWSPYSSGTVPLNGTNGTLLVRVPVLNDNPAVDEPDETFILTVSTTGGITSTGTATIVDDGNGVIYNPNGTPNNNAAKDDDRALTVSSPTVNEASPFAIFTVDGNPGQLVSLSLTPGTASPGSDYTPTIEVSVDGGLTWSPYSSGTVPLNGTNGTLLVRVPVLNDNPAVDEPDETFILTVSTTGGITSTGTATIVDDGNGVIYNPNGTPNNNAAKDDDRALTVSSPTVNEASPFAIFTVDGNPGQLVSLSLTPGTASPGSDYTPTIEVSVDGGLTWSPYSSGTVPLNGTNGTLLVRVPVLNDNPAVDEPDETFILTVSTTGGITSTGTATIVDDGNGVIYNPNGTPNNNAAKDDDRALTVSSPTVNEASPFAIFTVDGNPGQLVSLSLTPGTASPGSDYTPTIEVSVDGGLTWSPYSSGTVPLNGTNGTLLVRVPVLNDNPAVDEPDETFILTVSTTGGITSTGTATIVDDGNGVIYNPNGTPNNNAAKDDDREDDDGIPGDVEINLAANVSITTGTGNPGDLNGDGIQDNQQPAFAVLAWITVDKFQEGLNGTLPIDEIEPIISLTAAAGTSGTAVDSALQLIDIAVLPPDSPLVGGSKPTGIGIEAPWDPITFSIQPLAEGNSLTDIDENPANGNQVRVVIDISRAGVREGDFNGYLKYISQATIDAAALAGSNLVDLNGTTITTPGWIDFLQRKDASGNPTGNGARFITENGFITAFELTFTDNELGDNNFLRNIIQDPNLPVRILPPQLVPTGDGNGLEVIGYPGQTLWADFSAVLADAKLQNGLDMVRVSPNGDLTRIGSIGATPDSGFLGDTRVKLTVGDQVRFTQVSSNLPINNAPKLGITGTDNCIIIRLDDSGFADSDANDLVLKVKTSAVDPHPESTRLSRYQLNSEMAYLDLSWIPSGGASLQLDVKTDCGQVNTIRLVRVDTDPNTGKPLGTVDGVSPNAGTAFDNAVRNNLLSFQYSQSGTKTTSGINVRLNASDAGIYAPVLITPDGTLYTFGSASSSDGSQHIKTLGANSFGFEDLPKAKADWDFNDTVLSFRIIESELPKLELTPDGRELIVVAGSGSTSGLWLDLNTVLADANLQNNLDLIKRLTNGQQVAVGSIGATSQGTFLGSKELFLAVGERLRFEQNSNDNPANPFPSLIITRIGERYRIGLDDNGGNSGSTSDADFNDLIIDVDSSPLNPCEDVVKLASQQITSSDGILDLTGIGQDGLRLGLSVTTDSGNINTLSFVRLDIDPVTGKPLDQVAGTGVNDGVAFRAAVRRNLADFSISAGGQTSQTTFWQLNAADSGYYAAVLLTPDGDVFTFGDNSGADGGQHLKVFGDNSFGFEDLLRIKGADWDYNDFIVKATIL